MENPNPKDIILMLRKRLADLKAAGAPPEQAADEVRAAREVLQEFSASDPERRTNWDAAGALAQTFSDSQTFGLSGIASDALAAMVEGGKGGFGERFRANRDFRVQNKDELPWYMALPASIAGAVTSPVTSFLGAGKAGAGVLRTLARGAAEGAAQGTAFGVGENIGSSNDPYGVSHGVRGAVIGAPLGSAGAAIGRSLARRTLGMNTAEEVGGRRAGASMDAEKAYEVPVFPKGTGAPTPSALDISGPVTQLNAREAAKSVPARQVFDRAFKAREAEHPVQIGRAFDEATGTTAEGADALAREIATLENIRAGVNADQKASYDVLITQLKEAHQTAVEQAQRSALPKALDVLAGESGGKIPDAVKTLDQLKAARSELAASDYPKAIEATKGQPAQLTPEAEAFIQTPTGQAAWAFAQRARADVVASDPSRALPTVRKLSDKAPPGFTIEQAEKIPQLRDALTVDEVVPDAEAWHIMKQYLANAAKLGPDQVTPEGLSSIHAQNALDLHRTALDQQDELFRSADRSYADASGEMTATKLGMAQSVGNPPPKAALTRSLTAVEDQAAALPPNEADLFRLGGQHKIASLLRAGKRPSSVALLLEEPSSDLSRQVVMAYGEGAPQRIAEKLRSLEPPRLNLPPKPTDVPEFPEVSAAKSGFGITKTPSTPSPRTPNLSLPSLEQAAQGFDPIPADYLQRGAAGAFRRDLAMKSPLNLDVPERGRQFAFAAKSPEAQQRLSLVDKAWNDLLARQRSVLGQGAQLPDPSRSLGEVMIESGTPSVGLTMARVGRQLHRHPFPGKIAKMEAADEAFARLLTGSPEEKMAAVQKISEVDTEAGKKAAAMAGLAGRIGGSLTSMF